MEGAGAGALRDQIQRLGPRDGRGQAADALTIWNIESNYVVAPSGDGCVLRNIQVTLELTLTLPRWTPPSTAAPRLGGVQRGSVSVSSSVTWMLRSEEHTSELQSHLNIVCRLLLETKK